MYSTSPISESESRYKTRSAYTLVIHLLLALFAEFVFLGGRSFHENTALVALSRILVIFVSLYGIHSFALKSFTQYRPQFKDSLYVGLLLFGSLLVVNLGWVVAIGLSSYAEKEQVLGGVNPASFIFAIPFASGALLLQTVLGLHYSLVLALQLAVICAVYTPNQPLIVPYVLITSVVACLSIKSFRSRSAYSHAGFYLALAGLPFALASTVIEPSLSAGDMLARIFGPLICGALCSFLSAGMTPIVEYFGGYVTDLRLIEMATLDHPLLKELSVQAPGTWNHSMVMGMMSEAAANAIGANPIVARVGAYFHDIGKTKKPLYFVENQDFGENRHDKLSSSMSALIIKSHVKDGIELGHKHALPQVIIDMIPQHHGTALIEYFYDKASKEARETSGEEAVVDESLYRYPGPKPQTRESGILMLADGVEAAARTLSEPSSDRIQGLVQKMINKVFAGGQLDESELTLKDLHLIAKSFTRVLTGIYHQRITYHEPAEKLSDRDDQGSSALRLRGTSEEIQTSQQAGEEKPIKSEHKEDLKRLGQ